jgi:hypothetical protein
MSRAKTLPRLSTNMRHIPFPESFSCTALRVSGRQRRNYLQSGCTVITRIPPPSIGLSTWNNSQTHSVSFNQHLACVSARSQHSSSWPCSSLPLPLGPIVSPLLTPSPLPLPLPLGSVVSPSSSLWYILDPCFTQLREIPQLTTGSIWTRLVGGSNL